MRSFPKTVCAGTAILAVMSVLANAVAQGPDVPPAPANVVWNSPSTGANGSMPLGNGEVGVNLWVERDGDLLFYIARTDAWSECCQLLKLGRVRVSMVPNPFAAGVPYRQTLDLRNGCVDISAGSVSLRVFVDAQLPVVYVTCHSTKPVRARAAVGLWRTARRDLRAEAKDFPYHNAGSWTMRGRNTVPRMPRHGNRPMTSTNRSATPLPGITATRTRSSPSR